MKKLGCLLGLFLPLGLAAASLPLSEEGRQEVALYMDFLQAVTADTDTPRACQYYARAWRRASQSKYLRRQMLACALEQNDLSLADLYAGYIEEGENSAEDLAVYAFYQWRKGDINQARSYYEQALEKDPEDLRVLYQYILLLGYVDVESAVQTLQQRKEHYPSLAHVIDFETGNIYKNKKEFDHALYYYNLATSQAPDYPGPYLGRAEIYERQSQFFFMLRELEQLEKIGYESAGVYSRMGSMFVLVKEEDKARIYFEKAKKLDNGDLAAGYFLALLAEKNGDFASAARYVRETADFPTKAAKWLQVAFYEQQAGDSAASLRTLEEAYKKFDKNVEIAYFYGLGLQDAGRCRQAARIFKDVLQTNPQYENARLAYAFTLESCKKYKEMENQVRRLIAQNPKNAAAYNLLGFSLAQRGVRLSEARELVAKALALAPQDRSFIDSLAWVYYRQGDYAPALDLLAGLDEDFILANAEVAYHLGAVYSALGRLSEAAPYMRAAAPSVKEAAKWLKKYPETVR